MKQEEILEMVATMLPRRPIYVEGELYLERYYLAGDMNRVLRGFWPEESRPDAQESHLRDGWTHYLHCFRRPDAARDLHNHPWHGITRLLHGGYVERRSEGSREVWAGESYELLPDTYHTIERLLTPTVWTLFSHGPRLQGWGFMVNGSFVPNEEYLPGGMA